VADRSSNQRSCEIHEAEPGSPAVLTSSCPQGSTRPIVEGFRRQPDKKPGFFWGGPPPPRGGALGFFFSFHLQKKGAKNMQTPPLTTGESLTNLLYPTPLKVKPPT